MVKTSSEEVSFKDVLDVIKKNAFTVSPYPLIISLELDCKVLFGPAFRSYFLQITTQKSIATTLKEALGPMLPLQPYRAGQLPPPLQLQNKILLKGKATPFKEDDEQQFDQVPTPTSSRKSATPTSPRRSAKEDKKTKSIEKDDKSVEEKPKSEEEKEQLEPLTRELTDMFHLKVVKFKNFGECQGFVFFSFN